MTLRIGEQDIIADRDEAKRQMESHEQEAARWRNIYLAYDALARVTGRKSEAAAAPETDGSQNGHKPSGGTQPTIKEVLLAAIKENPGITAQDIRKRISAVRADAKDKYVYNLLTELTKAGTLDRKQGKYYEKKK